MLRAQGKVGDTQVTYHAAATDADTNGNINITPFTDLMIANIANQLAESLFANFENNPDIISKESLAAAETALQNRLQPILNALGMDASIDLLRTAFATNHTGLDAALDLVRINYNGTTASIVNSLNNEVLGTDEITTATDNGTALDANVVANMVQATPNAVNAASELSAWFSNFSALFANRLPTVAELTNSGLFDTSLHFLSNGANYEQIALDITSDPAMIGFMVTNMAISFTNQDQTAAQVVVHHKTNVEAIEVETQLFEKQNGSWKWIGNQKTSNNDNQNQNTIPERFSMEWLAGKTLYNVWYGRVTDVNGNDTINDAPAVGKFTFGANGIATFIGIFNDHSNAQGTYSVTSDGHLYFDGDVSEVNRIVSGSTASYIKTEYWENGTFDNVDLLFFDETSAINYAKNLTQSIPR